MLLIESIFDAFKDLKIFKGGASEAKSAVRALLKDTKYLKPTESKAFGEFLSKSSKLTSEEIQALKATGIDIEALKATSGERLKNLLDIQKRGRSLTPLEQQTLKSHVVELENAIGAIKKVKPSGATATGAASAIAKDVETGGAAIAKDVETGGAAIAKETKAEATAVETAATDGLGLTKEQRSQVDYWQKQADRFRKAGKMSEAAAADAKAAQIMGPEFTKTVGVDMKTAEQAAEEILRKKKLYDELVAQGKEGTQGAKDLLRDIKALEGKAPFLDRAWLACKNSPWICAGLVALTAYAAYKGAQALGLIDKGGPTPTPPGGGGGGRGCKGKSPESCSDDNLHHGCVGDNVKVVQSKLVACGFPLPRYGVDGRFCNETKGATMAFQKSKGLPADGIVGQNTRNALDTCKSTPTPDPEPEEKELPEPVIKKPQKLVTTFGGELEESLKRKRYNQIEKLVFERLVKNAN